MSSALVTSSHVRQPRNKQMPSWRGDGAGAGRGMARGGIGKRSLCLGATMAAAEGLKWSPDLTLPPAARKMVHSF
ncbi:hypothetical protein E2C01_065263 [Portunus trituberculatus]|uniref:Uncharacterized protein n=1 Tax=Portunus trituberculatus TaxID=210409 RepID=A0A5B7HM28_PORTR|nr:hypothetical protein [Portunus trituberculatus]